MLRNNTDGSMGSRMVVKNGSVCPLLNLVLSCCIFLASTSGYFCKAVTEAFRNTHEATCETYPVPLRSYCEIVAVLLQSCRETAAEPFRTTREAASEALAVPLRSCCEGVAMLSRSCHEAVAEPSRTTRKAACEALAAPLQSSCGSVAMRCAALVELL